jgi:hypothetical protein
MLSLRVATIVVTFALTLVVNIPFSQANGSPQWITGEVASIVEKGDEALISLKLSSGELYSIPCKTELLKGVKTGDIVTVQIIEGSARIIQVAESGPEKTPEPVKNAVKVQWVPGEVVSIQRGATDSLLSIKMSDGTVFNVSSSNDKIREIKEGDDIIAKVINGWAQSVTKK